MSDRISLGGTTLGGGQSTEDLGYTGGSSADSTTFDKPFSHFVPKIEYSISKLKSYVPPPQDTKNSYRREPSLTAGSVQMALKILNDAKTWAETRDRSTFVYSRYDTRDAWTNSRDMDIIRYMENAAIDPRPALFQASDGEDFMHGIPWRDGQYYPARSNDFVFDFMWYKMTHEPEYMYHLQSCEAALNEAGEFSSRV